MATNLLSSRLLGLTLVRGRADREGTRIGGSVGDRILACFMGVSTGIA